MKIRISILLLCGLTFNRADAAIMNGVIKNGAISGALSSIPGIASGGNVVTFDNTCSNSSVAGANNGCTITVGAGANNAVFFSMTVRDNIGQKIVDPVTIGSLNMVFVSSSEATSIRNYLYYSTGVPSGANSITATLDVAANSVAEAVSFTGVNQLSPINTPHAVDDASGAGTSVSLILESAGNQVCIDALAVQADVTGTMAASGGQTVRVGPLAVLTDSTLQMTTEPGAAGTISMGGSWTGAAKSKYEGVCIKP